MEEELKEEELEEGSSEEELEEEREPTAFDLDKSDDVPLDVRNIPLEDIAELPNIRPAYHGIERLAETIYTEGQLQPCLVRPSDSDADHGKPFELIFGYRRKRAIEFLKEDKELEGFDTIRCEVRDVKDEKELAKMIVENIHREDLSPVAEATAMMALKKSTEPEMTNAEVARQLGCDPSHVSHRISMVTKLAVPGTKAKMAIGPVEDKKEEAEEVEEVKADKKPVKKDDPKEEKDIDLETEDSDVEVEDETNEKEDNEPRVDILELVDTGKINASTAEVISSLDNRDDMEKLAELVVRNDWGVRRAEKWVRQVEEQKDAIEEEEDAWGPLELVRPEDVVDLPVLNLKDDLDSNDLNRVIAYALLRNGLDQEMLFYLRDEMGVEYEQLWDYLRDLSDKNISTLIERLAKRYITSAHRYHSFEPSLISDLAEPDQPTTLPEVDMADELDLGDE